MSLQSRITAIFSAVIFVAITLGAAFATLQARSTLRVEIVAALSGGEQTVRRAYEDLPRSDHQPRDLAQLVATFDGDRHVRALLLDRERRAVAASHPSLGGTRAPGWFQSLVAPHAPPRELPAPGLEKGRVIIVLQASPDADIGALWVQLSGVVTVLALSTLAGLVLVLLMVRLALSPLNELASGLADIGRGAPPPRVRERGPREVLELERSFNRMAEQLADAGRRNWALEQQLLTLQDEERAEIARDLHDDVGPQLFAVSLDAQLIAQLLASGRPEGVMAQIEAIQAGVSHIQREIRALVVRLRPPRATELGLGRALDDLVRFWRARRPEIAFVLALDPDEADLGDAIKDTAFRVVQEAVSNAVRHAQPTVIDIAISRIAASVEARVSNDGVAGEPANTGFGLTGMRDRVSAVGGRLDVHPAAAGENVWTVVAVLPQAPTRPDAPAPSERRA
jgi:two-component system, NarL family, sensor histidine kinase UhpB